MNTIRIWLAWSCRVRVLLLASIAFRFRVEMILRC
nr:MAG TPA: hypothetical protein [Caudoviricetes sp.]